MAVRTDQKFPHKMEIGCFSLNPEAPEFFPTRYTLVPGPSFPILQTINEPYNLLYYYLPLQYPFSFTAPPLPRHQNAVLPHSSSPERDVVLVAEPFKVKKGFSRNKYHWKGRRGCGGAARAARKKEWRAKPGFNGDDDDDDQASFECTRKVQYWAGGEKQPLIPLQSGGSETTIMIKNIPVRYTREMLKEFLDQHCMVTNREAKSNANNEEPSLSAYDFLYLPIDFVTRSNKGYAFVNFTTPIAARKFYDACDDKQWECFMSNKIRQIYCAKLQGINELVKHFEKMGFPCQDFQPLCFNPARDGSKQPVEETVVGRCIGSWCTNSKS
ncbi:hypothetical protein E1A91_A01G004100v1 [Gossypium mustelinum]|uniref:Mei2-like C-terminal RNA recognition motif domain-containing protein n=1 Tax=Gossypium mustelinum TaxID=34275 RepID=A0A5D3ABF6_GOSMU|nr:hypothetical protein E1A91_A01G004100v1 [Gossypium mustelinum]